MMLTKAVADIQGQINKNTLATLAQISFGGYVFLEGDLKGE